MVDSGANVSFMDTKLAQSLGIPVVCLPARPETVSLDGSPLWDMSYRTEPVRMICSKNSEDIVFFAYMSTHQPIVLGLRWLQQHNPTTDWTSGEISYSSAHCQTHCQSSVSPPALAAPLQVDQEFDLTSPLFLSAITTSGRFSVRIEPCHCQPITLTTAA